jgi:hypothetical protein
MSMDAQTNSRRSAVTKHFLNWSAHVAAAALCLGAISAGTAAGSFTRGCAARDLQILMLIEERESTNAVSAERLTDAMLTMMNARMLCSDGHEADALTMYDGIVGILTPRMNRRMLPSPLPGQP